MSNDIGSCGAKQDMQAYAFVNLNEDEWMRRSMMKRKEEKQYEDACHAPF